MLRGYGSRGHGEGRDLDDFADALDRARRGEDAGWSALYDEVAPLVLGYLRGHRASDPEDLLGEVMLQVVRDLDAFEGPREKFRSWVLVIAHHRMLDDLRYRGRRPADATAPEDLPAVHTDDDPADVAVANDGAAGLLERLDVLSPDQRSVILLRVVADLDVDAVAEVLGKRPSAVTSLQHRAITKLRTRLLADGEDAL